MGSELFEKTFEMLNQCLNALDDELEETEHVYRKLVIRLCNEIGDSYDIDLGDG